MLTSLLPMTDASLLLLQDTLQKSTAYLEGKGIELARREAEWIFAETLGLSRMELYTQFDMPLEEEQAALLRQLIIRRGKREPLAYVLGNQEFCGLRLQVSPAVLVPRPETEELIEHILKLHDEEPRRVIDVGTGSGAIALALKAKRPQWDVWATDISEAALMQARKNAEALGLDVQFVQGDLLAATDGQFDLIVANLPYVAESERALCDPETNFEPALALFADDDGMALIQQLLDQAPSAVHSASEMWLEYGFQQAAAVMAAATAQQYTCTIIKDLSGHDRMARIQVP